MIGRIYSTLSFDPIAAHPLALGFWHLVALAAFCFFPAYIVYAKQSLRRHTIYRACWLVFAVFFARVFMNVESIDLRHGTMVVFSNILYISVLVFAMIDLRDEKKNHARRKSFMATYVKHPLEALAVNTVWNFCRLLPPKWSSGFGGAVGRFVGRLNRKYTNLALENMRLAFPSKRLEVRRQMATQMWDMLGRYGTEPEHFKHILKHHKKYLSIYNDDILERLKGRPYIVITSHSGSMGLLSIPFALHKIPGHIVYKFPGNNLTADITRRTFGQDIGNLKFINNNTAGVREMMAVLRDKGALCIIPDHRLGKGIPTKFFGRSVLSPGGAAKLAGHFDCPILPVQIIRHEGLNHSIIFHEPFHASRGRDGRTDETKTTQRINDVIEGWIRENPEQWFWVHDRFGIKGKVRDAR